MNFILKKFWAPWCKPCLTLSPILESSLKNFNNIIFESVNIDLDPNQAFDLDIKSIPTLVFIKDGKPIDRLIGVHSKEEIEEFFYKNI